MAGLAIAAALVLAPVGCGGGSGGSGGKAKPTTTRTSVTAQASPPTTTRDQLKAQILADYKKALDAYHDAVNAGDPNLPGLRATHADPNLSSTKLNIGQLAIKGQIGRDGAHSRLTDRAVVVTLLADRAQVNDCRVDDGKLVDKATGRVVDGSITTRSVQGQLILQDKVWKLQSLKVTTEWQGVAGCA